MDSLEELFCHIDDCCQQFEPKWHSLRLSKGVQHRQRQRSLSLSELMTILVSFHQQLYRNFKSFYCKHVGVQWREVFPGLVSYTPLWNGSPRLGCPCACISSTVLALIAASASLTATASKFAIISGFDATRCFETWLLGVNPRSIGSLVSTHLPHFQLGCRYHGNNGCSDLSSLGKLAAIAVIRTFLNYFLSKELESELEMERNDNSEPASCLS